MKFAIFELVPGGHGRSAQQVYENNLELIQSAEDLGFYSAWVAEHHFSEYGLVNDILMFLASASVLTRRIRLGAGVSVVPLHNPIRLAENAAYVDIISGGRLDLGIGRGYQPHEFAAFDVPLDEAQARTEDAMQFIKRAWTEEAVDWDSPFFKASKVSLVPRPLQQPHPPVWTAAVSPSTFERCGRLGERILTSPNFTPVEMIRANMETYRTALAESGFDPGSYEYPVMQQVYVGRDAESSYYEPRDASMSYFELLGRLLPKSATLESGTDLPQSYKFYRSVQRNVQDLKYDFLYEHGVSFGDPVRVAERITRLRDEVGITMFQGWFNFGNLDHHLAMESLRRFSGEVMARFDVEEPAPVGTSDVPRTSAARATPES